MKFVLKFVVKPVMEHGNDSEQRTLAASVYRLALFSAITFLLLLLGSLLVQPTSAQSPRAADQAAIEVKQTVGETVGICTTTAAIAVTAGKSVYYCVTLRNNGTVPLSQYTLTVASKTVAFTQALNPGQDIQLTSNVLTSLGKDGTILSQLINGAAGSVLTNTVTITATNAERTVVASGKATAHVVIGSVGLRVTKTVGLTDACPTTKGIAVDANTTVKYCVRMENTGSLPLLSHRLVDPLLKVNVPFTFTIPVGGSLNITDGTIQKYDSNQHLSLAVTSDITNTAIITSTTAEGVIVSGSAQAVAAIGKASSVLTYTVGLEDGCAATTAQPFISGRTLYYCLKLTNNGTVPLEGHAVRWVQNSAATPLVNTTITQTVSPGQSLIITRSRIALLEQKNVITNNTNDFTVTSTNHRGMVTAANAKSTITVGAQTLTVTKYATTDRNGCVVNMPLNIITNQEFYYCVVITNTGLVPLVRHAFVESTPFNISGVFTYTLAPNQKMTLTNQFLASVGLPANIFGPFKVSSSYFGTLNVSATSANNSQVFQTAAAQVNVSAPTATATTPPTAIPTFTPSLTPIPSPSATLLPTPTPSPVVLSFQPTPTQPFSVNAITTPTPGIQPGAAPQAVDQFGQPIPQAFDQFGQPITPVFDQFGQPTTPIFDQFGQPISPLAGQPTVDMASTVFALTVEAAATQTALAFIAPPVIDTPMAPQIETPVPALPLATPVPAMTVVVTPAATSLLVLTPLPSPEAATGYLAVVAQVFQVSAATLGWLWFVVGSLIFFAVAGMFAGLGWSQRGRQGVYDMNERATPADEDMRLEASTTQSFSIQSPAAPSAKPQAPDDEDYWPASLR